MGSAYAYRNRRPFARLLFDYLSCGKRYARTKLCFVIPQVCPFQLSHGFVQLPDGSGYLQTADVSLHQSDWPLTSVCFHSKDSYLWTYRSTVVDPDEFPSSARSEGASQTDLVLLADGRTIMAVTRLGGGDGPPDPQHPGRHLEYYHDIVSHRSETLGMTWGPGRVMRGLGSVGPRLLMLGTTQRRGPLLMTAGRQATAHNELAGTDPRVFVSKSGMGDDFETFSISARHNAMQLDPLLRFSGCVNNTEECSASSTRESSGLYSLLQLNQSSAIIVYDKIDGIAADSGELDTRRSADEGQAKGPDEKVPFPVVFAMQLSF